MKKIITFVVPSYNSESYLHKCVDSLLVGGDEVEILIVNDGSTDRTGAIADEYEAKYPGIVRAIHQENKGHGGAINTGLANATGEFFKVVDSDDRVAADAYSQVMNVLRKAVMEEHELDLLISNYVYDKQGVHRKKVMRYASILPQNQYFTWDDCGYFGPTKYILMHSTTFRTSLLRDIGLVLPEKVFYEDNIFVTKAMAASEVLYYLDVNFYWYFIGRADQSVNEQVMIGRLDQQLAIDRMMIDYLDIAGMESRKQRKCLLQYLEMQMVVSSIMCILSKTPERLQDKKALWKQLKGKNGAVYRRIRWSLMGFWMNLPGRFGRFLSVVGYKAMNKIFGFN